jgi:hypothetical protein
MKPQEYDGIYFLPGDDDDELQISYFRFGKEFGNTEPIESTSIGHKYHVAFFKKDENGNPAFDDAFEAIFGDPSIYIQNLAGAGVYGCLLKKTEKSSVWFEEYLNRATKGLMVQKMIQGLKSILNTKL